MACSHCHTSRDACLSNTFYGMEDRAAWYREQMHGCLDCGKQLTKKKRDHLYKYDHGKKILLRGMTHLVCTCGYYEVEFPRIGPLHATIKQALSVLHVERGDLAFFFKPGDRGVVDGEWGVQISSVPA